MPVDVKFRSEQKTANLDTEALARAEAVVQAELMALREFATTSIDPNMVATYIALSNSEVQEKLTHKIASGYPFKGVAYPQPSFEMIDVVFKFGCKEGTLCLIPQSFLAIVNLMTRKVTDVVDPYIPRSQVSGMTLAGMEEELAGVSWDFSPELNVRREGTDWVATVGVHVSLSVPVLGNVLDRHITVAEGRLSTQAPRVEVGFNVDVLSGKVILTLNPTSGQVCAEIQGRAGYKHWSKSFDVSVCS